MFFGVCVCVRTFVLVRVYLSWNTSRLFYEFKNKVFMSKLCIVNKVRVDLYKENTTQ